jgi:dTDP-4-dehydrorhamnose 3,5-epimerase
LTLSATNIEGLFVHSPQTHLDERGTFFESFRRDEIRAASGFDFQVAQLNTSSSGRGVIRGIHFKQSPPGQAKFVSVVRGAVIDVVIDLRSSSASFGLWQSFELNAENRLSLLIGHGLGHSFLSLEEGTVVQYLCDSFYEPELEHSLNPVQSGIPWDSLARPHGIVNYTISQRDLASPGLTDNLPGLPS